MVIADETARLRVKLDDLRAVRSAVSSIAITLDEILQAIIDILGRRGAGYVAIAASFAATRTYLAALRTALTAAIAALDAAVTHHARGSEDVAGPAPGTSSRPQAVSDPRRPAVVNSHGDHYPAQATPYHDVLPPRVRRASGMPIAGYVQLDGVDIGEVTAIRTDPWAAASARRMAELGQRRTLRLFFHIEMKAIAMMIINGARHGQVIINHAPCGSEPGDQPGCHTVIAECLPRGRTLTVLGTDAQGNPFARTYHGKAAR